MKIIVTVRTLNESRNIGRFCAAYAWADKILVADGGSTDDTVLQAQDYQNVQVRTFDEVVQHEAGSARNPHGRHINFLFDWARQEGAEWIIFDDCDCVPNQHLQAQARGYLEDIRAAAFMAVRLHLIGDDQYFPHLSQRDGEWTPGLWAFRAGTGVRAQEEAPGVAMASHEIVNIPPPEFQAQLWPPNCLLHYSWPDQETIKRKFDFYKGLGVETQLYPAQFGGPQEPLPDWAVMEKLP